MSTGELDGSGWEDLPEKRVIAISVGVGVGGLVLLLASASCLIALTVRMVWNYRKRAPHIESPTSAASHYLPYHSKDSVKINDSKAKKQDEINPITPTILAPRQCSIQKNNGYVRKANESRKFSSTCAKDRSLKSISGLEESFFMEIDNPTAMSSKTSSYEASTKNSSTKIQTLSNSDQMPAIYVENTQIAGSLSNRPPMPLPRAPSRLSSARNSGSSILSLSPTPVTAIREYTSARLLHLEAVGQVNALSTIGELEYVNEGLGPS